MKTFCTFCFLFMSIIYSQAQLLFTSQVNTSSFAGGVGGVVLQGTKNVYVAFRRGGGSTDIERQMKVGISSDSGRTFRETDITISNLSLYDTPVIAATASAIMVVYGYADANNTTSAGIFTSTNSGQSFSQRIYTSSSFTGASQRILLNDAPRFITDGISKFYLLGCHYEGGSVGYKLNLLVSPDNGTTFSTPQMPVDFNYKKGPRLAATSTQLWFTYIPNNQDSIIVYRSSNDGQSWILMGRLYTPGLSSSTLNYGDPGAYDIIAQGDQLYLYYNEYVLSTITAYRRLVTTSSIGSANAIGNFKIRRVMSSVNNGWIEPDYSSVKRSSSITSNVWSPQYDYKVTFRPQYGPDFLVATDDLYYMFCTEDSKISFATAKFINKPIPWIVADTTLPNNTIPDGWFNLTWRSYFTTGNFRLQFSKTSDFSTTIWDTSITHQGNNTGQVSVYNINTKYGADSGKVYTRIRCEEGSYLSDWSDLRSINFKTPKVFLSQPFNGASFPNPPITSPWNDTITFNWISISDATSYWLQLSTDSNFLSNIFSGGNGVWTSSTHYDLVFNMFTYNNQRIFWRVCANFSGGTSSKWSEIRNISIGTVTGVEEHKSKTQTKLSLSQNYPNPFNPSTTIQYGLPSRSAVRIVIYDVLGRTVSDLVNTEQQAGIQSAVWNANASSGLYFYRLEATSKDDPSKRFVETKKMLLLK